MTIKYIKCPYCGFTESNSYHGFEEGVIDSPFQQCKRCSKIAISNSKKEWAMLNKTRRWLFIFNGNCIGTGIFFGVFIAALFVRLVFNNDFTFGLVVLFWILFGLLFTFLMGLLRYKNRRIQKTIAQSIERMKDPKYAKLVSSKFNVYKNDFYPFKRPKAN